MSTTDQLGAQATGLMLKAVGLLLAGAIVRLGWALGEKILALF